MARSATRALLGALMLLSLVAPAAHANHSTGELISDRAKPGADQERNAFFAGTSATGARAFFITSESLLPGDTDQADDIYQRFNGFTTLLSDRIQAGGDGTQNANFKGVTPDGTHVYFETTEPLVAADTDKSIDVYERFGSTTTLISDRVQAGADQGINSFFSGVSQNGGRVFFSTQEKILATDGDTRRDVYQRSGGTTTILSDRVQAGADAAVDATYEGASADGTRVFFSTAEQILDPDDDAQDDVYQRSGTTTTILSDRVQAGADADIDAFFEGSSSDGTRVFFQTAEQILDPDDDGNTDVYQRGGGNTTLISDRVQAGADAATNATFAGAASNGSRVFFHTDEPIIGADGDTAQDVYQRTGGTSTSLISDRVQMGPDEPTPAVFAGASSDGLRVFFHTGEKILAADEDSQFDVYQRSGTTTTLISDRIQDGTDTEDFATFVASSADGTRVFFLTSESLLANDIDGAEDLYERFNGETFLLTGAVPAGAFTLGGLSADGLSVFVNTTVPLVGADTDSAFDVYVTRVV